MSSTTCFQLTQNMDLAYIQRGADHLWQFVRSLYPETVSNTTDHSASCFHGDHRITRSCVRCHCPIWPERIRHHGTGPEPRTRSKAHILHLNWLHLYTTVKSKNRNSSHPESETSTYRVNKTALLTFYLLLIL